MVNNEINSNVGVNVGVNEMELRLVLLIEQNEGVNADVIAKLIANKSKRTIERYLSRLKESGRIEFRGSDKTGGYFIKK